MSWWTPRPSKANEIELWNEKEDVGVGWGVTVSQYTPNLNRADDERVACLPNE